MRTKRLIFLLAIGCCLGLQDVSAHAQNTSFTTPIIGANVDMGIILPGSQNYVQTPQGDLFDIAKAAKLNTLRITAVETWGQSQIDRPYTAQDWKAVAARAKATRIRLIPELVLPKGYIQAIDNQEGLSEPTVQSYSKAFNQLADTILDDAGLANDGNLCMIDLSNEEPVEAPIIHDTLKAVYDHIHKQYPGVLVTIGGYKSLRTTQTTVPSEVGFKSSDIPLDKEQWITGNPDDGGFAVDAEDVISVHIYGDFAKHDSPRDFLKLSKDDTADSVSEYLQRVNRWSAGKPILVEEFGSPSGMTPISEEHSWYAKYASPDSQREVIGGVTAGILNAKQNGVNVIGGLAWVLAPRGGAANYGDSSNERSLVIPQGANQPPMIMPALYDIHDGLKNLFAQ